MVTAIITRERKFLCRKIYKKGLKSTNEITKRKDIELFLITKAAKIAEEQEDISKIHKKQSSFILNG